MTEPQPSSNSPTPPVFEPGIIPDSILEDFTKSDLDQVISSNPNLRGYLQGYLAEVKLIEQLRLVSGVDSVSKIPDTDSQHGDLLIHYKGTPLILESKCLSSHYVKYNPLLDTWTGRVLNKRTSRKTLLTTQGESHSTHYHCGTYDILAVCAYSLTGKWDFYFMEEMFIPRAQDNTGLLATSFRFDPVNDAGISHDFQVVADNVFRLKSAHGQLHPQFTTASADASAYGCADCDCSNQPL